MRLLDLFCGAGGAAMGYHRAGFDEIVGVDIAPQPHYPFEFVQADALTFPLDGFDAIHASPPCQAYSVATVQFGRWRYPDLVGPVRDRLGDAATAYVIENVPGAPLQRWVQVCGSGLGIRRLRRHRWFESDVPMWGAPCVHGQNSDVLYVTGHSQDRQTGSYWGADARRNAMGIDWMSRDELTQAIPPAYTEFIGRQLLAHMAAV